MHKAQVMQRYAAEQGVEFACPALPPLADASIRIAEKLIRGKKSACLIGSSLGGFYATWLAEKHGLKAVLINPAIDPHVGLRAYLVFTVTVALAAPALGVYTAVPVALALCLATYALLLWPTARTASA